MNQHGGKWLPGLLVVAGVLLAAPARAAETPFAGTWKVVILDPNDELALWLVKVEDKGGKPAASLLSAGLEGMKNAKVTATDDDKALRLTFTANDRTFAVVGYPPKGEKAPKKLLGSVSIEGGGTTFVRLERTDDKTIDPKTARKKGAAAADVEKVSNTRGDEQDKVLREILKKYPDQPIACLAAEVLLLNLVRKPAVDADDARKIAEAAAKVAEAYGPELHLSKLEGLTSALAQSDKTAKLGVEYGRKAEKLLAKDTPASTSTSVLSALAAALRKAGNEKDADALDTKLDEMFEKTAIPFKVDAFAGRKGKSDRVALVELFTGAQCPPCVAADVAFDAALKAYKPSDVVLLQYHLHIPRPDPLTNKDSEKRSEFYDLEGTPSVFLNGETVQRMGGFQQHAKMNFEVLTKKVAEALEKESQGKIKLTVDRKDDKIDVKAEVSDLKKTGDDVRLRLVLVEDVVKYAGTNGQRLHHHVVRAFPGGADGTALKEKTATKTESVSLTALTKALKDYLAEADKARPFPDKLRPMELKKLKVVAFIQDNKTKEVLNAVQADVPAAK